MVHVGCWFPSTRLKLGASMATALFIPANESDPVAVFEANDMSAVQTRLNGFPRPPGMTSTL